MLTTLNRRLVFVCALFPVLLCLQACDSGSQEKQSRSASVKAGDVEVLDVSALVCEQITLAGPIQASLEQKDSVHHVQSDQGQVTISAPASERPLLEIDMEDRLHIQHKGESKIHIAIHCPKLSDLQVMGAVEATLESPTPVSLQRIAAYGSSKFIGPDVHSVALEVRGAGSASVSLGAIDVDEVDLLVSGKAQVELSGMASQARIEMTGQSVVAASGLRSQWLEVQGRGASQASVQASAHLGGTLSGNSKVQLDGEPDINLSLEDNAQVIR